MKNIAELNESDLSGKRVLVRVDWNVPLENGEVRDDFRIKKSLPTLEYLKEKGAKVVVATHLEPTSAPLEPLNKYLPEGVELLPNLRLNPGEEANDEEFAKSLADTADIYVNEAFSVSHRNHASVVGVPKFLPSYAGFQFAKEVGELSKAFNPKKPFFLIFGGAKFETKLPILEKLLPNTDSVFIGGAMAKAALESSLGSDSKLFYTVGDPSALDANVETLDLIKQKVSESNFILWNGPVGFYEKGYKEGTLGVAKILAESGKETIVGGGDTLAAIKELGIEDKFTFVSTAGGAMLDFLAKGTLPGVEALGHSPIGEALKD